MITPYVTSPADKHSHNHSPTPSSITWDMGTIAHYSSQVIIGTVAGDSDVYVGKAIVNNARYVTDNAVPTPGGPQTLYTQVKYCQTIGGIPRSGGTITSFYCI